MPMLAEPVDAVVGVDTHRDTHEVEIALPTGTAIGTRKISNDSSGFAELLASISFSHPDVAETTPRSPRCRAPAHCRPAAAERSRHRLNCGGDRALNSAIHTIAITRMRCCPTTKDYVARRTAEGKSSREIKRCLKRYIARELYRALNASTTPTGLRRGGGLRRDTRPR